MIDIRLPLGALFATLGLLLVLEGVLGGPEMASHRVGFNVNLVWGACMVCFGALMLLLARRRRRRPGTERPGTDR